MDPHLQLHSIYRMYLHTASISRCMSGDVWLTNLGNGKNMGITVQLLRQPKAFRYIKVPRDNRVP